MMPKGRTRRKVDPNARRAGETHWQWRDRVAIQKAAEERKGQRIVTPEAEASGLNKEWVRNLDDGTVTETYRRRSTSSLERLEARGVITDMQLQAARDIAEVAERIERQVGVKTASLMARVDCEGSGRDPHYESLTRVRYERAYSDWRLKLPLPRRMVLDMVTEDHQLAAIGVRHGKHWRAAIETLKRALDKWEECKDDAFNRIDQDDVDSSQARLRA